MEQRANRRVNGRESDRTHQRTSEDGNENGSGSAGGSDRTARSRKRGARRLGPLRALVAVGAAAAVLLTGCTSGGSTKESAADGSGGDRADGLPGPSATRAPWSPGEAQEQAPGTEGDEAPSKPPAPDFLSTFALDVDTASYGFARRSLEDGRLPDPGTVRPEEFVNSFRQDYRKPKGDGFSVTVDGARTEDEDWSLLRVGLATRPVAQKERPPAALTFVVDVSGSMAEPGRLDLVRDALKAAADGLRDDDSLAIVAFSNEAEVVLDMTRLDGNRDRIHSRIETLEPTDSTNLDAGVRTGYDVAAEGHRKGVTNRVVLLSDALANTGETDSARILDRIEDERREHGITLFGVGVGSEYGDSLMEDLADKGDGHTTYVSERAEARALFTERLPANVGLRARDAKAQVAFDPKTVRAFRLIGYDNREVADDDFRNDRVDGGEVGPGHTVTALYAVRTKEGAEGPLATARVRWLDPDTRKPHEKASTVHSDDLDPDLWNSSTSLRTVAVAAYFAEALRADDPHHPSLPEPLTLAELDGRAEELANDSGDRDVDELAEAIHTAAGLRDRPVPEETAHEDGGGSTAGPGRPQDAGAETDEPEGELR
ncbi:von Willebrand factor type A domain-containing protein [Streptomyces sp. NA04227]|uniref:vWA domain-containing protein n=1 Tax=Streptomyces sp. NA04227 TaxID=2742136 RepID=UPI0015908685|nr:von Willebrand factor type A domain-containing protein [Streptomyces sp. NA04227]QKW06588.1 von Willebrand factor type A domain-containing protein [Streptomyces sp. NA04227]